MLAFEETDDGIALRMLHFDAGLKGWEAEAEGPLVYPLTEVADGQAVFEDPDRGYPQRQVYERKGTDGLEIRLEGEQQGRPHTVTFTFQRAK